MSAPKPARFSVNSARGTTLTVRTPIVFVIWMRLTPTDEFAAFWITQWPDCDLTKLSNGNERGGWVQPRAAQVPTGSALGQRHQGVAAGRCTNRSHQPLRSAVHHDNSVADFEVVHSGADHCDAAEYASAGQGGQ